MDLKQRIVDFWDKQPCNILHSNSKVGTVDYFSEVNQRRYFVEPHIPEFAGFHLWQGKRVLEIGCGIGSDAEEFAKHGADYVGIDISAESISMCRQRFDVLGLEGEFYVHNCDHGLEQFGEFDLAYSYGVLHHYPNITRSVNFINQALVTGGEFRFMVYAKNSWKYAMIQKGLDQFEAQAGCPYAEAYTESQIQNLLSPTKWSIERLRQSHCFMYNVEEYKKGNYVLEPWFEAMPEAVREAVCEYLGWHLLVKAKKKI
jgi:SAM-dependent methyltransferase